MRRKAKAAKLADRERRGREQAEADGVHIVREMGNLLDLAEKYGFERSQE